LSSRCKSEGGTSRLAKVIQLRPRNSHLTGGVVAQLNERGVLEIRVAAPGYEQHEPARRELLAAGLCAASQEGIAGLEAVLAAARRHVQAARDE
jgi:hypothetical protein